ncbi:MAG: hypothetical protein K9K32_03180 [Halanaerobiales bacterium]|nr:hypothetical protein [Halanaerobiales bacterium]
MDKGLMSNMKYVLIKAKNAHHKYEQNVLDGKFDKNWYKWYADFILNSNIQNEFEGNVSEDEMIKFLKEVTDKHSDSKEDIDWEDYVAKKLVEKFIK